MSLCNLDNIPSYVENPCGDYLLPGIVDLAIIAKDHQFTDFEDETEWQAEIAAGRVVIMKNVKADYPTPSAIEQDVPNNRSKSQKVTGYNHVINIQDGNVSAANDLFAAALNGKESFVVTYNEETDQILVNDVNTVTWLLAQASDDTANAWQTYNGTAKWYAKPDWAWKRYTAPTGIFS